MNKLIHLQPRYHKNLLNSSLRPVVLRPRLSPEFAVVLETNYRRSERNRQKQC
jgi:hypothetical protein